MESQKYNFNDERWESFRSTKAVVPLVHVPTPTHAEPPAISPRGSRRALQTQVLCCWISRAFPSGHSPGIY
jgi:hypothetical protein